MPLMPVVINTLASTIFAVLLFATIHAPGSLIIVAQSLATNCYRIVAKRRLMPIAARRQKIVEIILFSTYYD
jgi:hypothetical protein